MKSKILTAVAALAVLIATSCTGRVESQANYRVIPLPSDIEILDEANPFTLDEKTVIAYPADNDVLKRNAELLQEYLSNLTDLTPKIVTDAPEANVIVLAADLENDNKEAYEITVDSARILINGASEAGNFYGIQTIRKSIPEKAHQRVVFPAAKISDAPRFAYRGAHFDVSRHFFPVDSVKAFIDMIALHNINRMHWHITDDQGWRIEIKKYPKLTEVGSNRAGTMIDNDFDSNDSIPYGGFYTQEEAREIVKYAADRHITIIPEIDLPGHMLGALAAYPELGCTGGPYDVWCRWGISEDVLCAGNDSVYTFLDNVLTEICDIFPSELIHIGGDECPKTRWESCKKCQARIKELGLKSDAKGTAEQKLQTYVMQRATETLARHGRRVIGWDEMLEGGATEGSVVMSWRGEEGAVEAARQGHDAILTPTNYCYFDYFQSLDREGEPVGIGGYLPVEKVYSFEPISPLLTSDEAKHILGAQANLWTEYIGTLSHAQYMELPRLAAMSEVQWCQPEKKNYVDFLDRLPQMVKQYEAAGYKYARHLYDIAAVLGSAEGKRAIEVNLSTVDNAPIHYTLDGSEPGAESPLYTQPLEIDQTCVIKAVAVRPEGNSKVYTDSVAFNKATSGKITLANPTHSRYDGPASTLVDGRFGSYAFNLGTWLGFEGKDLVATIDMTKPETISEVTLRTLVDTANWIFDIRKMTVEVSMDGKEFKQVASEEFPGLTAHVTKIEAHKLTFEPIEAQYVRVIGKCEMSMPEWHGAAVGSPAFLFVDEIMIN